MNLGPDEAYHKAQDLLARRNHFSTELRQKLKVRGFAATDIDSAIDRLTEYGYLDDLNNGVPRITSCDSFGTQCRYEPSPNILNAFPEISCFL